MNLKAIQEKPKIALVTGGMGFIGSHLLEEIEKKYEQIIVIDNLTPTVHQNKKRVKDTRYQLVVGDVADKTSWARVSDLMPLQPHTLTVFHLAANTSTGDSINNPSDHVSTNVLGTALLCEFLSSRINTLSSVILTSTRAVYGEGLWSTSTGEVFSPNPRDLYDLEKQSWNPRVSQGSCIAPVPISSSKTDPNPVNIYGATKLSQEHILEIWCKAMNVELRIYRLQNVYGPGQSLWNSYSGVISLFVKNALTNQPIEVYEGGGIVRDLVYVKDIAKVLAAEIELPSKFSTVDVGSGVPTTLHEVALLIAKKCGSGDPVVSNKFRVGDVRGIYADVSAILGLKIVPEFTSLEVGISELLDWAKVEIKSGSAK